MKIAAISFKWQKIAGEIFLKKNANKKVTLPMNYPA